MPIRCVCVRDFSLTTKHPLMRCLMQAWHTHACLFSIVCLRPTDTPIGQPFKGQWLMFFESVQRSSNRIGGFTSHHFAPFATLIVLVSLLHLLCICVKTEWLARHSLFSGSANRVNVLPNCCECSRYSEHTPRNTNHLHVEVIVFLTNLPICRFRDLC